MEETNETWRAIRRLWPIIMIATLLGAAAAFFATPAQVAPIIRSYRARTTMLVSNASGQVGTVTLNQVPLFATTGEVPKRVAAIVKWRGEPAALAAQVQAAIDPNTGTFTVTTQQTAANRAVLLANTFADQLVTYLAQKQDEVLGGRLADALKRVDELKKQANELNASALVNPDDEVLKAQRDAAVRQYGAQYEQYQSLNESLTAGLGLTTLERAQAVEVQTGGFKAPQSRAARIPFAAVIGGVLGLGIVMLMERFDGRVRDRRRAEQVMGAPVVAELATLGRRERGTTLCVAPENQTATAESFRTLRTALTFLVQGDDHGPDVPTPVIVVSSPSPGDGKTTTAANLAAAFAETCERVVVVNADFRHPRIAKFFLDASHPDPLAGHLNFENTGPEHFLRRTANPAIRVVDLSSLNAPPGELTRATTRIVTGLRPWVDVVIIDTPPLAVTAEALEFMHLASLALVIGRVGRTRVRSAIRASELMRFAGATIVSVALTDTGKPGRSRNAYYRYAYSGERKTLGTIVPGRPPVSMPTNEARTTTAAAMNGAYGDVRTERAGPADPPVDRAAEAAEEIDLTHSSPPNLAPQAPSPAPEASPVSLPAPVPRTAIPRAVPPGLPAMFPAESPAATTTNVPYSAIAGRIAASASPADGATTATEDGTATEDRKVLNGTPWMSRVHTIDLGEDDAPGDPDVILELARRFLNGTGRESRPGSGAGGTSSPRRP